MRSFRKKLNEIKPTNNNNIRAQHANIHIENKQLCQTVSTSSFLLYSFKTNSLSFSRSFTFVSLYLKLQ